MDRSVEASHPPAFNNGAKKLDVALIDSALNHLRENTAAPKVVPAIASSAAGALQ